MSGKPLGLGVVARRQPDRMPAAEPDDQVLDPLARARVEPRGEARRQRASEPVAVAPANQRSPPSRFGSRKDRAQSPQTTLGIIASTSIGQVTREARRGGHGWLA